MNDRPSAAPETGGVPYHQLKAAFERQDLFENKTWQLSPEPFPLTARQLREIEQIGEACHAFYQALDLLYQRSVANKNLLRNREFKAPWVARYLERGKPESLIAYGRLNGLRGQLPQVIRPDLLLTEEGFVMTEIDSVPGGIGLTAFLNRLYQENGAEGIVGADDAQLDAFHQAMARLAPDSQNPFIAIVVSDEAATYRPEMEWLAGELQKRGKRVFVFHPTELMPLGDKMCVDFDGNPEAVDVVYRFWELFDLANVAIAPFFLQHETREHVAVTPPMKTYQEEKLNLALFHHHMLEDFWRENLPRRAYKLLTRVIPRSWILDPVELPPNAVLDAPPVGGKPIHRWEQLADASKKDRNLIIKLSGFHENAWGARSVVLGSDCSREEWASAIEEAVRFAADSLFVLQEYRKPVRLKHPVYRDADTLRPMESRVRLCPYYFVQGDDLVRLGGILATVCPADKKIIHGMTEAALLPCAVRDQPAGLIHPC
ncbi:MAG: hypothetical protein ACFE0O_12915 [Opitutales bacterium]